MRTRGTTERWEDTSLHLTVHCRMKMVERSISELDIERTVHDPSCRWPAAPRYGLGRFVHEGAGLRVVTGTPRSTGDVDVITAYWLAADGWTGEVAA